MTRLISILLALPLAAAFADTIKLKSGETLEGTVVRSDAKTVTVAVNFTPTIIDEQTFSRADIAYVTVAAADEIEFAKIRDLQSPDTALSAKDCQKIIDEQLQPFLKQFPTSARVPDVKKLIAPIQADVVRLKSGDVKIAGMWYDKTALVAEKYQVQAATVLEGMKQQIAAKNYAEAVNSFDLLQRSYVNSTAFAEGFSSGMVAIEKLREQLAYTLGNLAQTKAQRQAVIDRTPVEQRQPIQQAILAEDARAAAVGMMAQKNQQRYYTLFPFDEKGLKSMQTSLDQFEKLVAKVDPAQLAQGTKLVRKANQQLSAQNLIAAKATLEQLKAVWPSYEALPRLTQQLQNESDAATKAAAVKIQPATKK